MLLQCLLGSPHLFFGLQCVGVCRSVLQCAVAESLRTSTFPIRAHIHFCCCNTLHHTAPHCNTLQQTATHCNTLHLLFVAVCRSVLQCVAVSGSVLQFLALRCCALQHRAMCCSVLQCRVVLLCLQGPLHSSSGPQFVAGCCSVLQFVVVCCSVLPTSSHSLSGLQRVAVCCSVLQCLVAVSCCSVFKDLFLLGRHLLAQNIRIYQKGSNSGKSSSASCVAMCGSVLQCVAV